MNATTSLEKTKHYPVMLNQILSIISPQHGGTFIDCTFGGGGYSKAILKYPNTKVLAIDRDELTKSYAKSLSGEYPDRLYQGSTVALHYRTGELVWWAQHHSDMWNDDAVYDRILVTTAVNPNPPTPLPMQSRDGKGYPHLM